VLNLDLSGKVAVVTGGSGELGRVIVRTLADCGADVAVQYLNNEKNANAAAAHAQRHHRRTLVVQADVTSKSGVLALRDKVSAALGVADIIVNCAVIQYTWTTVLKQAVEDYEGQFRSSVLQNVLMAQAFVPAMAARKWGRVIGINTECTIQCNPDQSAYIAGKRGMDGVLRVLAKEVGEHNITVNQIAPGWTISDKYRGTDQERQPAYEKNVPLRRRGTDQEIANVVAFLASDLASFITGAFIPVCGGTVMPGI
jgi:3-oxoacyl-[acyl-carrier protein] reductase